MNKKLLLLFIILILNCILISGCRYAQNVINEHGEKIKMFIVDRDEAHISSEMPVIKALEEKCKIQLELEACPSIEAPDRFKKYVQSGNVPDIVIYKFDDIYNYSNAFIPLNELINEKTPNLQKAIIEDKEVRDELTALDGKIYAIPMIASEKVSQVYFARTDWLEKLKVTKPKTIDDFYNMLVAIRDGDPNGNGQKDEIPFVTRFRKNGLMQFLEPFGISEEFYLRDGKIHFGAADPEMKNALAFINKLYKEELIDTGYVTADSKSWQDNITRQKSGVLFDWLARVDYCNNIIPNANFEAFLPPTLAGQTPSTHYQMPRVRGTAAAAISKNTKYKEKIMMMYDYIFSKEGIMLTNFGIQNEHYTLVNGEPVYTEKIMADKNGQSPQIALWSYGIAMDWASKQDSRYEKQFLSSTANKAREMYNPIIQPALPRLKFTTQENAELNECLGDIRTYKDEWIDRFIIGTNPLTEFDQYVSNLKRMGLDRVLEIYNNAYSRDYK